MKWTEKEYIRIYYTQWSFVCETFIFKFIYFQTLYKCINLWMYCVMI